MARIFRSPATFAFESCGQDLFLFGTLPIIGVGNCELLCNSVVNAVLQPVRALFCGCCLRVASFDMLIAIKFNCAPLFPLTLPVLQSSPFSGEKRGAEAGGWGQKVFYCVLRFANVNASPGVLNLCIHTPLQWVGDILAESRPDNADGRGLKAALKAQHIVYAIFVAKCWQSQAISIDCYIRYWYWGRNRNQ